MSPQPLAGTKILDFTRDMAGPYASMTMSDHGADVIKVEGPPHGEPLRRRASPGNPFLVWNRGKRSICIDLRHPEGQRVVRQLARGVDVVLHNFSPTVPRKLGFDWETLRRLNPRLVYVCISAFGPRGPWTDRPGGGTVVQALSGVMSLTTQDDGTPVLLGPAYASFATAQAAVQAMLLGLMSRSSSGAGQYIEVPMLSVMLSSLTSWLEPALASGRDPTPVGTQHSQFAPLQVVKTADGYALLSVSEATWGPFCHAIAMPEMERDPRFTDSTARLAHRSELAEIVNRRLVTRDTAYWDERLTAASVAFGAVNRISQAADSEQVRENEMLTAVEHPAHGPIRQAAPVIRMSETPPVIRGAAPELGEHNAAVLAEFGFTGEEIERLSRDGVLHAAGAGTREVPRT